MPGTIPNLIDPLVDSDGRITPAWSFFFQMLTASPGDITTLTLSGSPFQFTAGSAGALAVSGGTVNSIMLTRGTTQINTGAKTGLIPVALGDTVTITYTQPPTISFVPT